MKLTKATLGSIVFGLWSCLAVWAAPSYVNYQGLLNGANGQPLPTGNYTMEFRIYDQAQLGSQVWGPFIFDGGVATGHGPLVPVVNGHFNVIIGPQATNGTPISAVFGGTNRYMEITVGAGPPILPRQQFLSTAYAFEAINAQYAQQASSLIQDLADALCPPGSIMAFGGPTNRIPSGWLLCDGRALATNNYARLHAAIGFSWGGSGVNFNLPDLRAMFLRGANGDLLSSWSDPDRDARTNRVPGGNSGNLVGSIQLNAIARHTHPYNDIRSYSDAVAGSVLVEDFESGSNDGHYIRDDARTTGENSVYIETRPNNAYVNYIIKY